ncbi:MAG TPA: class I SAM-dependent methyltransferase [Pyrinomonadaceae bacterium]|nr:class I SAM-dependent methyltransferase [Pyrinomonadaceae bacterium]
MPHTGVSREIDDDKMNAFLGKVVTDFGSALSSMLSYIGVKLGLYEALAESDGLTPAELAQKTGTTERYVREWLINQASGEYIHYDPASGKYSMLPEQSVALTDESSPFYMGGGFYVIKAMLNAQPRIIDAFKYGGGMFWGEHDPDLFIGTEKFFRPGYTAHLVNSWIPSLTGIEEKLQAGAKVADIGCGHGSSTVILAEAFPNSQFYGFDNHDKSIQNAASRAETAGVDERVTFEVADAAAFPGDNYDLICYFDCLHDMGNPHGAMKRAFDALADDGRVLIVEPMAGDQVEGNFNPVGRTFSGASTLCCTPNSLASGGPALGAVATEEALREVVISAGFSEFRRTTETPFNRVFEARK